MIRLLFMLLCHWRELHTDVSFIKICINPIFKFSNEINTDFNAIHCLGLYDGAIVSCRVVDDLPTLDTVYVTATNQKDWEILVSNFFLAITTNSKFGIFGFEI